MFSHAFHLEKVPLESVVEKQIIDGNIHEIIKEAQTMQALVHPNIPTILGVQIEEKTIWYHHGVPR